MHDAVRAAMAGANPLVERISREVWDLAELSLCEVESAKVHQRELEAAGFTVVSTGTAGVPTAFVAEVGVGTGGPTIGFLAEFDALPDLGNAAVPRQEPRADGQTTGHGCGHNLLGAAITGAAVAAKEALAAVGGNAALRVYGCASEETEGANVYMARDGLFGDVDVCLHWHPAPLAGVMNIRLSATNAMKIEFHGRTAHAGNEPWKGRSAVHAAEIATHAINVMREHLEPTARVHYVYEVAGTAPNVVPEYARIWLTVRDIDRAHVEATTEWIRQIAEGAALATQTQAVVDVFFGLYDVLPNRPLAEHFQGVMEQVGTPEWTDEEQDFARACQRECGIPEAGLATSVLPLVNETTMGGSSDVGDVSWLTPTMGIAMPTMPLGVSLHTWPVTACGGGQVGLSGALKAAEVLARVAFDLARDADLRAAARADFDRRVAGAPYRSPLPDDRRRPSGLPSWLVVDGTTETMDALGAAGR